MDAIQQALAVTVVLMLLGGSLFWLRSKGIAQFGLRPGSGVGQKRMRSLERLLLTPQHSLHLVRVGNRLLVLAVWPGGCSVIERNAGDVTADEGTLPRL
jgi:flagellar biogenesis protein FliO